MLTIDSPIATERRPAIRAYVKSRPDFEAWHMGLLSSRNVHNRELLRFCEDTGRWMDAAMLLVCPLRTINKTLARIL